MLDFFKNRIKSGELAKKQYSTMDYFVLDYYKALRDIKLVDLEEVLKSVPQPKVVKDLEARVNWSLGEREELKAQLARREDELQESRW